MKTLLLLGRASLKHRLKMLILTGITVGLVSFMACLSLLLLTAVGTPAEKMMKFTEAPDLLFWDSSRIRHAFDAYEFWQSKDEVENVQRYPVFIDLDHNPRYQGEPMEMVNLLICEGIENPHSMDYVIPLGNNGSADSSQRIHPLPARKEIWIPQALAKTYEIKVGDFIEISTAQAWKKLKISGIVIDPYFNLPMMNPRRVWVSPGFLAENFPASKLNNYCLALRFAEGIEEETQYRLWNDFVSGSGFSGYKMLVSEMTEGYGFLTNIMGAVLGLLALIAFLGGMAVISSTISQAIQKDFKIIGILQTIGFSPGKIAGLFLIQLLPVYLIFSLLGAVLSPIGLKLLVQSTLEATGAAHFSIKLLPLILAGLGITLLTTGFTALYTALKAGKLRTAEAIRFGEEVADLKSISSGKPLSSALPLWASLGFRQAQLGGKKALTTALTLFFAVFASYLCLSSIGAMDSLSRKPNFFDMNDSDVNVVRKGLRFEISHSQLMEDFNRNPLVERVLQTGVIMVSLPAIGERVTMELPAYILEGDLDAAGIETLEGDHPAGMLECAVNSQTAALYGLTPGSEIEVDIEGNLVQLNVSGIYQSMNNRGHGLRISAETIRALNPVYAPITYDIYLKDKEKTEDFISDLTYRLGEAVTARPTEEMAGEFLNSILSDMNKAVLLASLLFVIISAATLISASLFETRTHAPSFALLGLVGFTSKDIRRVVASKMFIISLVASLAGILISIICSPVILLLILKTMGLVKIPFFINIPAALLILFISISLSVLVSWLTSLAALKTNIRQLVME